MDGLPVIHSQSVSSTLRILEYLFLSNDSPKIVGGRSYNSLEVNPAAASKLW